MANFYLSFVDSVGKYPDAVAVEMQRLAGEGQPPPPERHTYRDLRRDSERVARWLQARPITAGARCAILAKNSPRWLNAYLGTIAAGGVAVPLDTNFNVEQVAKLLKDSGSELLFVDAKNFAVARRATGGTAIGLFLLGSCPEGAGIPDFDSIPAETAEGFSAVSAEENDTAVIVYTSGTTSDPKGVMLTHGSLAAEREAVFRVSGVGPADAILGVLPLFHVLSQMANLLLPLAAGARVVFLESANTTELMRALRDRGITLFVCVPQFFYLIHERVHRELEARGRAAVAAFRALLRLAAFGRRLGLNLGKTFFGKIHRLIGPDMRLFVTGGARMDPQICRDFRDMGFEILQAYGLSETTGAVFCTPIGRNVAGSVGVPMHGVRMRLADAKPDEESRGQEVGEICISSPNLMKGYYNRPEATAEVLKDGWLSTGDLGRVDAEGNLFISGRKKEMIVLSSGKNIFPEEIEAHYLKSPFIKEMCLIGLQSRPGEPFSERLHGVLVPNFEVLRERKIVNTAEMIRFDIETLSAQLPATKRLLSYDLWQDDLPRTTTKKLKRFEIEKRVRARQAEGTTAGAGQQVRARELTAEDRQWLGRPEVARAMTFVRAAAKDHPGEVHPKDNIELDLGVDSVERVELAGVLQRELGSHVPDWSSVQVFTVRELVDAVLAHMGGTGAHAAGPTWGAVLTGGTDDPEALEITRPRPVADRAWGLFFRCVNLAARALFGLRVTGLENLPADGAFILAPNHQSYLDGPVLLSALPAVVRRNLFYVGTSEIFGAGILRRVARSMRLIPIDPDVNMVSAMKAGAYGLSKGRSLVLFPEGERSIDGKPKTFKKGAAILSAHVRVPICPVALQGFHEAWPRGGSLRWSGRLSVAFGKPLPPPERVDSDAAYAEMTATLKQRVMELLETVKP